MRERKDIRLHNPYLIESELSLAAAPKV